MDEEQVADLLAFLLAGRPERLNELALGPLPEPVQDELRAMKDTLATTALAEPAVVPSPNLRARILASVTANRASLETRRALLVVDMLNDHLTPGRPLEVPRAREIVPAIAHHLERARAAGTPVVYVVDEHEPDDTDLEAWRAHNVKGTEGAAIWPPLAPAPGDRVVPKPTYSAFARSSLDKVLEELAVDTLVLTGCLTEIGILATATDALQRGYAVEVPGDAHAGATEATEHVALGIMKILAPYGPARRELLRRHRAARDESRVAQTVGG